MGNGSGIIKNPCDEIFLDTETSGLSVNVNGSVLIPQDIQNAIAKSMANFGASNPIIFSPQMMGMSMGTTFTMTLHPEYLGTPWAEVSRMTKREHAVAKLHTFLSKLKVTKKFQDEDWEEVKNKSIKRLKRAKWAKYQQKRA